MFDRIQDMYAASGSKPAPVVTPPVVVDDRPMPTVEFQPEHPVYKLGAAGTQGSFQVLEGNIHPDPQNPGSYLLGIRVGVTGLNSGTGTAGLNSEAFSLLVEGSEPIQPIRQFNNNVLPRQTVYEDVEFPFPIGLTHAQLKIVYNISQRKIDLHFVPPGTAKQ